MKKYLHEQHKIIKNKITTLIHNNKKSFYNNYFKENSLNIKKLWKGINELCNKNKRTKHAINIIEEIDKDGKVSVVSDPQEISNKFNEYFSSIAEQILSKRKYAE